MKNITSILAISIFLTVVLACSQGTKPAETTKQNESNSNGTKPETTKNDPNKANTSSNDLAGSYSIKGSSLDGKGYDGELVVTKRDDVYQMSWSVGGSKYDGVAVQNGNALAAAYTTGTDGKGCGAVIYKINQADDSLEGKWGEWGVNQVGTETATAMEKVEKSIGVFNISGTNGNGTSYKGKLGIRRDSEDVYQFAWDTGTKYIGTGVKMGDYLAAGSGSKQCGFVIYEVKDGKLEGKWGVPGTTKLGAETALRK